MPMREKCWYQIPLFLLMAAIVPLGCGGSSGTNIDQAFCDSLGLEYRETIDGTGYCYESGVDCNRAEDGTACDDGNACTFSDVCTGGECRGTPFAGLDDDNPCTEDSCDPTTGEIIHDPTPLNGTGCDDNDVCSSNDTCSNGVCLGDYTTDVNGDPIDDGDACTRDFCDATGTRANEPYTAEEAALLGLGDITVEDVANPCLEYECVVGASDSPHMNILDRTDCSDPDEGRTNGDCVTWTCQTGQCAAIVNEEVVQSAPVQGGLNLHPSCRMRECNTRTGLVDYVVDLRKVGEPCDDGNTCTFNDECHIYGQCGGTGLAHGTPCEDGSMCTLGDICHDALCQPGKDILALANEVPDPVLPDPDDIFRDPAGIIENVVECRQYVCDQRGVVVVPVADGTACDDGNPCTATSTCQAGECFGVRDTTNDGDPCDNWANECEVGECDKGVCVNFQPVAGLQSCTGSNPCKEHHCEDIGGNGVCVEGSNLADGTVCGELTECQDLICQGGMCAADPNLAAHQGEPCGAYDSRCNQPACDATATCVPNSQAPGTACTLSVDDLVLFGLSANDLVCNIGQCQPDIMGLTMCTPVGANDQGGCDNANLCDGTDWCLAGRCQERYTTDDPDDPDFDNLVPSSSAATSCELDGDPSTVGRCRYSGECVEISRVADDVNECTYPVWNEAAGGVEMIHKPNGTRCHQIAINPCVENHGVCLEGECHVNPMPDGTLCDLVDQAVPAQEDLPADHRVECYAEICVAGVCVVNTAWQDGDSCNDGETTCTQPGACAAGLCQANATPHGYGETCSPRATTGVVDIEGNAVVNNDLGCWTTFECSEGGTCNVAVAKAANTSACDANQDGDTCDGWCNEGICEVHTWGPVASPGCDDGNPCTTDRCNGNGGCENIPLEGPVPGCMGLNPDNPCLDMQCQAGTCQAVNNNAPCDDGNLCTNPDQCTNGACVGNADQMMNNMACGDMDDMNLDDDCRQAECANGVCAPNAGFEAFASLCGPTGPCNTRGLCDGLGNCTAGMSVPDGTNCDTNGTPCDEACLDIDGPDGSTASACVLFDSFYGLLTPSEMASNGSPLDADGWEETACRQIYDPTYDPDVPVSGNTCTRYVCYFGACRPWNDALAAETLLGPNPTNGLACGDSGECTRAGQCFNNACDSYHHEEDGTICSETYCDDNGDMVIQPVCQAGACTVEQALVSSCSRGIATCQASRCAGGECSYQCQPATFDYANVFEDISSSGTARSADLASPYDTNVTCGQFDMTGMATEMERMACDDGSVLLDLAADLGFVSPDGAAGNPEGFWFYNRRFRHISISANGTVLFHKDHPEALSEAEHTLFVFANVGGSTFDPDAGDAPGDPVNDGSGAAQVRVFMDDLTFISDITEDPPANPGQMYGNFYRFGEIYTKHMPGPDGVFEDGNWGNYDDYLIIQWDNAAFYGCALDSGVRSRMTVQMKWWPATGMIVFAYPKETNDDGLLAGPYCLPGRINGSDASIGLVDEGGAPADIVGERGWLVANDSGPGTDLFDGYYLFWPVDRPITHYDWRGQEWFEDLSIYDPATGDTIGHELVEVSNCDDCCQRVDFDEPLFLDGQARTFMNVCSDGYIHFMDYQSGQDASLNAEGRTMLGSDLPDFHAAPFWADLRMEENNRSAVYWREDTSTGARRIIVQWNRADYDYQIVPFGLLPEEQEKGEPMCSDNIDNDADAEADCDDSSCACAAACGGPGCGLTFQAIFHAGLGLVEFRYQSPRAEFRHAEGSATGIAVGFQQSSGLGHGIDLKDGVDGGGIIPENNVTLDPDDIDEQLPVEQLNILLPHNGFLLPYGE